MTDLSRMTYGELVDSLRKDLQLDARTDVLPGTILASLFDQNGAGRFLQAPASIKAVLHAGGVTSTATVGTPGTADWSAVHNATGDYTINYTGTSATEGGTGHLVFIDVIKGSGFVLTPEIVSAAAGTFHVQFFDPGAAQRDTNFTFIAVTFG